MKLEGRDTAALLAAAELARLKSGARLRPIVALEGGEAYATNGDVAMRYQLEAPPELPGPVRLGAEHFAAVLGLGGGVTLEASDTQATLEGEGARYTLPLLTEEPPQLERAAELTTGFVSVPVSVLSRLERLTSYAASSERTRYAMNGMRLELSGSGLRAVATDGKRLAVVDHAMAVPDLAYGAGVVPVRALQHALKMAKLLEAHALELRITSRVMSFSGAGFELTARLVEGSYPPYAQVIPEKPGHTATVERRALQAALGRAVVVLTREYRTLRMKWCGRCLTLSANAADVGSSSATVDIDYGGPTLEIGINPAYIGEALKALEAEAVSVELRSPGEALVIRADGLLYVVMPVNL